MDYTIIDIPRGKQIKIDIPIDITCMEFSFVFFDDITQTERSSIVGRWVVDDGSNAPKRLKVPIREFEKISRAVNYARAVYIKYLKEEIRRVKECDENLETF